jgi:hypothetical protein
VKYSSSSFTTLPRIVSIDVKPGVYASPCHAITTIPSPSHAPSRPSLFIVAHTSSPRRSPTRAHMTFQPPLTIEVGLTMWTTHHRVPTLIRCLLRDRTDGSSRTSTLPLLCWKAVAPCWRAYTARRRRRDSKRRRSRSRCPKRPYARRRHSDHLLLDCTAGCTASRVTAISLPCWKVGTPC